MKNSTNIPIPNNLLNENKSNELFKELIIKWFYMYTDISLIKSLMNNKNIKSNYIRIPFFLNHLDYIVHFKNDIHNFFKRYYYYRKQIYKIITNELFQNIIARKDEYIQFFIDIYLIKYTFYFPKFSNSFLQQFQSNNFFAISNCIVIKKENIKSYLWYRKYLKNCDCTTNKYIHKYFNFNSQYNTNNISFCHLCKKDYIYDKTFDIYINYETIITSNSSTNIKFHLFLQGNFLNLLQEGDIINFVGIPFQKRISKEFKYDIDVKEEIKKIELNVLRIDMINPNKFKKYNNENEYLLSEEFHKGLLNNQKNKENIHNMIDKINSKKVILSNIIFNFMESFSNVILKNIFENFLNIFETINYNNPYKNEIFIPGFNIKLNDLLNEKIFLFLAFEMSIINRDFIIQENDFFEKEMRLKFQKKCKSNNQETQDNYFDKNSQLILQTYIKSNLIDFKQKNKLFNHLEEKDENEENNKIIIIKDSQLSYNKRHEINILKKNNNNNSNFHYINNKFNICILFDQVDYQNNYIGFIFQYYNKLYTNEIRYYPRFFDSNYQKNKSYILDFLFYNKYKIIIIENFHLFSKQELEIFFELFSYINSINDKCFPIVFWFFINFEIFGNNDNGFKILNKIFDISEIILNYSKRFNIFRGIKTFENKKIKIINNKTYEMNNIENFKKYINILSEKSKNKIKINQSNIIENEKILSKFLLEQYFLNKINVCGNKVNDYNIIYKYAKLLSCINKDLEEIIKLNDSIIAIILYEELSCYKYNIENSLFDNITWNILYNFNKEIVHSIENTNDLNDQNISFKKSEQFLNFIEELFRFINRNN